MRLAPRRASAMPPTTPPTIPPIMPPTRLRVVYSMPRARNSNRHPTEPDAADTASMEADELVVLIAEDEETIAEALALIVEDRGHVAVVAHDGREALALVRQRRPHLIITDLMMPHLSGADLIAQVRRDAAAQGQAPPPVLVVTALSLAAAERAGADAIIAKPFDVTKIEDAMQRLLHGRPT